jgi:hypothetical protein
VAKNKECNILHCIVSKMKIVFLLSGTFSVITKFKFYVMWFKQTHYLIRYNSLNLHKLVVKLPSCQGRIWWYPHVFLVAFSDTILLNFRQRIFFIWILCWRLSILWGTFEVLILETGSICVTRFTEQEKKNPTRAGLTGTNLDHWNSCFQLESVQDSKLTPQDHAKEACFQNVEYLKCVTRRQMIIPNMVPMWQMGHFHKHLMNISAYHAPSVLNGPNHTEWSC